MIKYIDLYNDVTGQPWSMFDGDVESEDEFESTVKLSIQKALTNLWLTYDFPFRERTQTIKTKPNRSYYEAPNGNIIQKGGAGTKQYSVKIGNKRLAYMPDYDEQEEKTGEPDSFYLKSDRIYLYPTPDDVYSVSVDFYTLDTAIDAETEEEKGTLEKEEDYINLPESGKYDVLFRSALLPLAMVYAIASNSDENHSGYQRQYEDALQNLINYSRGINLDKTIGW